MFTMKSSPCLDCESRTVSCHASCDEYKKAKQEHDATFNNAEKKSVIAYSEYMSVRALKSRNYRRAKRV